MIHSYEKKPALNSAGFMFLEYLDTTWTLEDIDLKILFKSMVLIS